MQNSKIRRELKSSIPNHQEQVTIVNGVLRMHNSLESVSQSLTFWLILPCSILRRTKRTNKKSCLIFCINFYFKSSCSSIQA